ncbi:MAG: lysophospholipid acyltransferase family protein [Butyrivibrio sp.]
MNKFFTAFTKITAYPMQFFCFRTKVYYEDRKVQGRRIKGPAIIISNHTAVYDYAVFLFVFFGRTLRYQMAEVLFEKKFLGPFLKAMGGIRVDRNTYNFSFIEKSEEILREGGVVGIFPESRLPRKDEERPLPFKPSAAFIAINSGVPVIPVYTNGSYFNSQRARVIIGKPINPSSYIDSSLPERENIHKFTDVLRDKILELRDELTRQTQEK